MTRIARMGRGKKGGDLRSHEWARSGNRATTTIVRRLRAAHSHEDKQDTVGGPHPRRRYLVGHCLAAERRLRRVIRKLPILGAAPQQGRVCPLLTTRHENTAKLPPSTGGRPPALPIDKYLSWMSPIFPISDCCYFPFRSAASLAMNSFNLCAASEKAIISSRARGGL